MVHPRHQGKGVRPRADGRRRRRRPRRSTASSAHPAHLPRRHRASTASTPPADTRRSAGCPAPSGSPTGDYRDDIIMLLPLWLRAAGRERLAARRGPRTIASGACFTGRAGPTARLRSPCRRRKQSVSRRMLRYTADAPRHLRRLLRRRLGPGLLRDPARRSRRLQRRLGAAARPGASPRRSASCCCASSGTRCPSRSSRRSTGPRPGSRRTAPRRTSADDAGASAA